MEKQGREKGRWLLFYATLCMADCKLFYPPRHLDMLLYCIVAHIQLILFFNVCPSFYVIDFNIVNAGVADFIKFCIFPKKKIGRKEQYQAQIFDHFLLPLVIYTHKGNIIRRKVREELV